MRDKLKVALDQNSQRVIDYRRSFHQYPEIGWTEVRTASIVASQLTELGFSVALGKDVLKASSRLGLPSKELFNTTYLRAIKEGADIEFASFLKNGFTALVATLVCGDGPTVAFRFDLDALQVDEKKEVGHRPFEEGFDSQIKGVMHACGHDGHVAMGLGLAHIISELREDFNGTYKLIFQPAEESVRGAKAMVEAGVLEGVDLLIGAHLGIVKDTSGVLYTGTCGFLATSKLDVRFKGKASHAGVSPEKGQNALLAAASAALQLHAIPRHSDGITRVNVGRIEGGSGRNVIPENALLMLETRGASNDLNNYMLDHVEKIVKGITVMYDVDAIIEEVGSAQGACSDHELAEAIGDIAQNLMCYKQVYTLYDHFGGCEDFTYMMNAVQKSGGQATYILLATELVAAHHNGFFDFKEDDMLNGVLLFANIAYELGRANDF